MALSYKIFHVISNSTKKENITCDLFWRQLFQKYFGNFEETVGYVDVVGNGSTFPSWKDAFFEYYKTAMKVEKNKKETGYEDYLVESIHNRDLIAVKVISLYEDFGDKNNCVILSIYKGDIEITKFLLKRCNMEKRDFDKALEEASINGELEIMKEIFEMGAEIDNKEYPPNEFEPIFYASSFGYTEIVRLLLEKGANPRVKNDYPLVRAARGGYTEIVKLLIDAGCDPSSRDNEALVKSAKKGHTKVVRLLLQDSRVDPTARKRQAQKWATINQHEEIIKLLLQDRRMKKAHHALVSHCPF